MQTLEKQNGALEESRKSSTCQPGSVSIKYSDMVLVAPTKFPPPLSIAAVEVEFLTEIGGGFGFEIAGEAAETDFLVEG